MKANGALYDLIVKIREGFNKDWFEMIPQTESLFLELFLEEINFIYDGPTQTMLKLDSLSLIGQEIRNAKYELIQWKICDDCYSNKKEFGFDAPSCNKEGCIDGYKRTKTHLMI